MQDQISDQNMEYNHDQSKCLHFAHHKIMKKRIALYVLYLTNLSSFLDLVATFNFQYL